MLMVIIVVDGVGELLVWVMVMGGLFGDTSRGNRYEKKIRISRHFPNEGVTLSICTLFHLGDDDDNILIGVWYS